MTASDDNVFARWARRKQAVREAENNGPEKAEREQDAAGHAEAAPADAPSVPAGTDAVVEDAEVSEPLPRIEDLTVESDLSAFLRRNVPKALKSAAMRRMWSLDPAIRDFVGPSEYAWDFNQPGSMAGFGPLDGKAAVVDFLSTVQNGLERMEAALETSSEEAVERVASSPAETGATSGGPAPVVSAEPLSVAPQARQSPEASSAATPETDLKESGQRTEAAARLRHGSAMPR